MRGGAWSENGLKHLARVATFELARIPGPEEGYAEGDAEFATEEGYAEDTEEAQRMPTCQ